jgi:hypothetical protein
MSKTIAVPLMATPVMAAVGLLLGAAWLAGKAVEKGQALAQSLSPEDLAYLSPFGATRDRVNLEAKTVTHQAFQGVDFSPRRPAFGEPRQSSVPLPSSHRALQGASVGVGRETLLQGVEAVAGSAGFRVERRALLPGASVLVFDLCAPQRVPELVPREDRWQQ